MTTQGPLSGRMLGKKYLLGELLGYGGFGEVYKAQNLPLNRPQAIKVILEKHLINPAFRERFMREARTLAALNHPNIVHIDDFEIEYERAYLVMPFISGGTLHNILVKEGPLPLEKAEHYLKQIGAALHYAHARNVVHLDLKPQNLLHQNENDVLLLSDFGLAHLMKQGAVEGGTSLSLGSPLYMAPEQINGSPQPRSDIYALGVILYLMLAGRPPFVGSAPAAIALKHVMEPPPPLSAIRPDVPRAVVPVVEKALAKKPEERYATAGALLQDFHAALFATPTPPVKKALMPDALINIFISYAHKDSRCVNRLEGDLHKQGFSVWVDRRLEGGQKWRRELQAAVDRSQVLLVVLSPDAVASEYVQQEYGYAIDEGKAVIPLYYRQCKVPMELRNFQWIDFRQSYEQGLAMLLKALQHRGVIPGPSPVPIPVPSKRGISRRTVVVGLAGLVGVGVAGGGLWLALAQQHFSVGTTIYTYTGHHDIVNAVAWSPDGTRIASGSADHSVQVWDATTGKNPLPYYGHSGSVNAVVWSPNGTRIASGSGFFGNDYTVQVWDATTGGHVITYNKHTDGVNAVAWSPDGTRIVSGSGDKTVQVWDVATGDLVIKYTGHSAIVNAVAWSHNGTRIASGSSDKTVQVWDATTGGHVITYNKHSAIVNAVAWSPDGTRIVSGSADHTAQEWDAATGGLVYVTYHGHSGSVDAVAWTSDGTRIASGGSDYTVQVWDAATGKTQFTYHGHFAVVHAVAWSPDGTRVASGSGGASIGLGGSDNTVQVWEAE